MLVGCVGKEDIHRSIVLVLLIIFLISGCENIKAPLGKVYLSAPEAKYTVIKKNTKSEPLASIYIKKEDYRDNQSYLLNGSELKLSNLRTESHTLLVDAKYRGKSDKIWVSDYLGFGSLELNRWSHNYTLYIDYVYIDEFDFNSSSLDWNYIKVALGRYKEGGLSFDANSYREYLDNNKYCINDSECAATCGYGCVNKYWFLTIGVDCEAEVTFGCKCEKNSCEKT